MAIGDIVINWIELGLFYLYKSIEIFRAFSMESSRREVLLKISQNTLKKTFARVQFLIKLQTSGLQLY